MNFEQGKMNNEVDSFNPNWYPGAVQYSKFKKHPDPLTQWCWDEGQGAGL